MAIMRNDDDFNMFTQFVAMISEDNPQSNSSCMTTIIIIFVYMMVISCGIFIIFS